MTCFRLRVGSTRRSVGLSGAEVTGKWRIVAKRFETVM
jgi:hypothetical protein